MKTISTLLLSIITLVASANVEITNIRFATTLSSGNTENAVVLNWTASNVNSNATYEIERAFYSNNFSTVANLTVAFNGNSSSNFRINDNDAALAGRQIAYYRVKQTSADGTVSYSNTMLVSLNNNNSATASENNIRFTAEENGNAIITLKSSTGATAASFSTISSKGSNQFNFASHHLNKGIYFVEISVTAYPQLRRNW